MILNKPQTEEFERLSLPLIKFINDYMDPHCKIIIDTTHSELVSGVCTIRTNEFIKD